MLPIQTYFTTDVIYYPKKAYSARSLVKAYWKKDYSELDFLPSIQSESISPKSKFKESLLDISGTFGSMSRRQIDTDRKIRQMKTYNTNTTNQRTKTPKKGKIIKGQFLKQSTVNEETTHYKDGITLQKKLLSRRKINKISFNPPQIKSDVNIKLKIPLISKQCEIVNHDHKIELVEQPIQLCQCKEIYSKSLNTNKNILVLYFDGMLGFDEKCFFGENQEYIDGTAYKEYCHIRQQDFTKFGQLFYFKKLNEVFKVLSQDFYIILLTSRYQIELLQLVKENKLNVDGIYEHECRELNCLINFKRIIQSSYPSRIYFIQPVGRCINLFINRSSKYLFRIFYFPQLNMQSLHPRQSYGLSLLFIAALNSEIEFNRFITHYKFAKAPIINKCLSVNQYTLQVQQQSNIKTKKEMIRDILSKFQWSLKIETLIQDLVHRNKKIRKRIQATKIGTNQYDFTASREKKNTSKI